MASSRLLEARTSEVEIQKAQRRAREAKSRLRVGKPLDAFQRPTLQPTLVPPSGKRRHVLVEVSLWRPNS